MNKIVVYTAIFGEYDTLIEQPMFENIDYVCFTDRMISSNCWKVKVIDDDSLAIDDNSRKSRHFKILPHLYLNDYEVSIYIDGNFLIKSCINDLIITFLTSPMVMICFDHNQTILDPRNCIYKEYLALINLATEKNIIKDDIYVMNKQIEIIKEANYPPENGLISAAVLIRKHNDSTIIKVMEDWWFFVKNYSKRDQLSFNFVAWKHNFKYDILKGDIREGNEYFKLLNRHISNNTLK